MSLLRKDASGNNSFNGTYSYTNSQSQTGNQLQSITNAMDSKTYSYTYDTNGNTTLDGLRGFTISYNLLNLPSSVSLGTNILSYIYSATGEKLAKVKNGSVVQYYCGNMIYNNAKALDYLLHEEGMVKNISGSFTYEYFLRDHLGDTRAVVNSNGGVEQSTDYYPFGLAFQNNNLGINKYLYNGKEIQDETLGTTFFGEYDYGARFYDPQIGRFSVQDRFSEKYFSYNPYHYCFNNPVRFIDENGDSVRLTDAFLKNDQLMRAHLRWMDTEAGTQFYKLFGKGGEFEQVVIVFDAVPEDKLPEKGDDGNTNLDLVKDGEAKEVKIGNVSNEVKDAAQGKSQNSYLRFTIQINSTYDYNLRPTDFAELIDTYTHEGQHTMIDLLSINKLGKIVSPRIHHILMKDKSQPYYQTRYKSFWQIKDIWTPTYMEKREEYKKDIVKFIDTYINSFRL